MMACAVTAAIVAMASPAAHAADSEIDALKAELAAQRKLIDQLIARQVQPVPTTDAAIVAVPPATPKATPAVPLNVKLYGIVDVQITNTNSGYGRKTRVEGAGGWSNSRIGLSVSQTFDNGLTALAVAEGGVQFANGTIGAGAQTNGINDATPSTAGLPGTGVQLFARQAYGALQGDFGTVSIGRQYTASYVGSAGLGVAHGDGLLGNAATIVPLVGGMPTRVNNSLIWKTPKYHGLYGWGTYFAGVENNVAVPTAVGTTTTTDKAGRGIDIAAVYSGGPLTALVSAWTLNNNSWVTAGETGLAKKKGFVLAGNYNFGLATAYVDFASGKISGGNYENVTKTLSNSTAWALGVTIPFGNGTFLTSYTNMNDKSLLNRDMHMIGTSYWYTFAPNLRVYTSAGKVFNSAKGNYSLSDGGNLVGSLPTAGVHPNGAEVGFNFGF